MNKKNKWLLLVSVVLIVAGMIGFTANAYATKGVEMVTTIPEEDESGLVYVVQETEHRAAYPSATAVQRTKGVGTRAELDKAKTFKTTQSATTTPEPVEKIYTADTLETKKYNDDGIIYVLDKIGFLYVPNEVNMETKGALYFAGGGGEDYLSREAVKSYLENFSPNAVILFFYESGFSHMEEISRKGAEVLNQVSAELGIDIKDVITVGSSNGTYAALKASAVLQDEYDFRVTKYLALDAGMNWDYPKEILLSDEQMKTLKDAGTELYLFEQPHTGKQIPAIARMVNAGLKVYIVECQHMGHDQISKYGFRLGVFSFGFDELDSLSEMLYEEWGTGHRYPEYAVVELKPDA